MMPVQYNAWHTIGNEYMATDLVTAIARSLNYYFILFHSSLRENSNQCSTRTHKVGAGGTFVSKALTLTLPQDHSSLAIYQEA